MARFSGGGAVVAGFQVIARDPLAFMGWTLAYLVVGILPQLWTMASVLPMIASLGEGAEPSQEALMRMQSSFLVMQPVSLLSSLVSSVMVMGAVFRAVLQPQDRAFLYLRLGGQEFWLGLILVTLVILYMVALLAMMIPLFILIGIAAATGGEGPAPWLMVPLIFAVIGAITWGWMRVSLSLPMSFAERNFRLPEAWNLSRGQAGKMFLVSLVIAVIIVIVEMVLVGAGFAAVAAAIPLQELGRMWLVDPAAVLARVGPPVWIGIVVAWATLATLATAMFAAALARIYADLKAEEPAP